MTVFATESIEWELFVGVVRSCWLDRCFFNLMSSCVELNLVLSKLKPLLSDGDKSNLHSVLFHGTFCDRICVISISKGLRIQTHVMVPIFLFFWCS